MGEIKPLAQKELQQVVQEMSEFLFPIPSLKLIFNKLLSDEDVDEYRKHFFSKENNAFGLTDIAPFPPFDSPDTACATDMFGNSVVVRIDSDKTELLLSQIKDNEKGSKSYAYFIYIWSWLNWPFKALIGENEIDPDVVIAEVTTLLQKPQKKE